MDLCLPCICIFSCRKQILFINISCAFFTVIFLFCSTCLIRILFQFCGQWNVKGKNVPGARSQFCPSVWAFPSFLVSSIVYVAVGNLLFLECLLYPLSDRSWLLWFDFPFYAEMADAFSNICVLSIWLLGPHFILWISWKVLRNNPIFILF